MRFSLLMTARDLLEKIDAGSAPLVVDVRTRREFASGHVPGAINVPLTSLALGAKVPGGGDAPVVVYCGHGPRARMAASLMRRAGCRQIQFLEGHMAGWRQARLREEET